jgi:hypothetical protein
MTVVSTIKLQLRSQLTILALASVSIMIVSDPLNCVVTYNRHYDDRNSFIIQATALIHNSALSTFSLILSVFFAN